MKRVERPPRVYYIERHFLGSILCIGLSLGILLAFQFDQSPKPKESNRREAVLLALVYALPLAGAALILLFRVRAFAIDRGQGELLIVDRPVLRPTVRRAYPIEHLSVRRVTVPGAGGEFTSAEPYHAIWIDFVGSRSILFQSVKRGPGPVQLAERLADDLGRPLTVADRTR